MSNDTFEMSTGQAHEFAMACGRNSITRAEVKLLSTGNNLRRSLDFLNGATPAETRLTDSFTVTVDHDLSLARMIKAGAYDWVNDDITEKRFPVKGEGSVERTLTLHHYARTMDSDAVVKDLDFIGKEAVPIEDLLAFGAQFPDEQRKYPIIALGSSARVHGGRRVPYLDGGGTKRYLYLHWCDSGWLEDCRFLARNKVSVT